MWPLVATIGRHRRRGRGGGSLIAPLGDGGNPEAHKRAFATGAARRPRALASLLEGCMALASPLGGCGGGITAAGGLDRRRRREDGSQWTACGDGGADLPRARRYDVSHLAPNGAHSQENARARQTCFGAPDTP